MWNFLKNHPHFQGIIFTLSGYFLFSANDALRKYLMQDYDVFTILFWYNSFSLIILLFLSHRLGGLKKTLRTKKLFLHVVRAGISVISVSCAIYAFGHLPLVDAYTLIFVSPFIVALISALFFKERLSVSSVLIILLGFSGVLIALRPGFSVIAPAHIAALGVAVFYSLAMLLSKPLGAAETKMSLAFYPALAAIIFALVMMGGWPDLPANGDWMLFVVSGVLQAGSMLLMSLAFASVPGALLAPLHYSQIFWGLLIGLVVFGDVPDIYTALGTTVIIGAGLYLLHSEKRKSAVGQ